jgi:centromere protein C
MPSSARKSSIGGSRRGPLKAHVPFRGDNPAVGKKTGIAVAVVDRRTDGFEPFEEIISQADTKTPPKMKSRKRKHAPPSPVEEDEDGEMSMDMDDSNCTT